MKLKIRLSVTEEESRIVKMQSELKLLDKPITVDSSIVGYSLFLINNENKKIIASTVKNSISNPPDSWIEFVIKSYEKQGSIPEYLEVEEVSGCINVYKETIPLDIVLTFFNELGEYKGYKLVKNYSLEEVKKLCSNAYAAGRKGFSFEDWCKDNL